MLTFDKQSKRGDGVMKCIKISAVQIYEKTIKLDDGIAEWLKFTS